MKLTALEENSLRCLVKLARNFKKEAPTTIREMSDAESMSTAYVAKVMALLQKGELVAATRGVQGGYTLTRSPEAISLAAIFHAVNEGRDDTLSEIYCCDPERASEEGNCTVGGVFIQLSRHINEFLESVTLWTLAAGPGGASRVIQQNKERQEVKA